MKKEGKAWSKVQKVKRITIHIGLHKTGTSFLQKHLLKNLPEVALIMGWYSHRQIMNVNLESHLVISDEVLSGRLWGKKYLEDFYLNIKKIIKLYGNPKIIFGIRNQETFIPSVYKQYLHEKGYKDFNFFFNINNNGIRKMEDFLLMPKINYLKDNFTDVFIYSQKDLQSRQGDFLSALSEFMELKQEIILPKYVKKKENVGVNTSLQVNILKKFNYVNSKLEQIHPNLSLYSKVFRKLGITPRHICQDYLKNLKSQKFEIPSKYKEYIREQYKNDWNSASNTVSF